MRAIFPAMLLTGLLMAAPQAQADAPQSQPLKILRMTPSGADIDGTREIVFTFNRAVVPVGVMERDAKDIPVTVTPAVDCEWRWLNTTSLSCQLGDKTALIPSTAYSVVMKPGISAEDGATIAEDFSAGFTTQRADVTYSWFKTWRAPGSPVVRLTFNQPVTKNSVTDSMEFLGPDGRVTTNGKSDGGTVVKLSLRPDPDDREPPVFVPLEKGLLYTGDQPKRHSDEQTTSKNGIEARRVWLAEPVSELQRDSNIVLRLHPGLVSALGDAPSVSDRDAVTFDTFPTFAVAGVRCMTNADTNVVLPPQGIGDQALLANKCNPLMPISIAFTTPVQRAEVKNKFTFLPKLGAADKQEEIWGDVSPNEYLLDQPHVKGRTYDINLPYGLKAATEYTVETGMAAPEKPKSLFARLWAWVKHLFGKDKAPEIKGPVDAFDSRLDAPVKIVFSTDHRKPNFEMPYHEAVLEKDIDSEVPLYVNNLDHTAFSYRSVTAAGAKTDGKSEQSPAKVQDIQYAIPMKLRDMLGGKTGAVYGRLDTTPVVDKGEVGNRLFAIVSPWQMHVKLGHYSTLVWLTDMKTGTPAANVKVTLYKDSMAAMSPPKGAFGTAETDENGVAMLPGTETADPQLELQQGWEDGSEKLFVSAQKDDDFALMPLNSDFALDTWRASDENIDNEMKKKFGHLLSWGTTAQGIYRAGDTIQYKIYVRAQNDRTLTPPPAKGYKLEVVDPTGNVVDTKDDVTLNAFGAYDGSYAVSKSAPVGWYKLRLTAKFAQKDAAKDEDSESDGEDEADGDDSYADYRQGVMIPMKVLVSDFTPAPFHMSNSLNGDLFAAGQDVEVQADARLHSGGPYTDASVRTTAILQETVFTPQDPKAAGFTFRLPEDRIEDSTQVFQKIEALDAQGSLKTKFTLEPAVFAHGRLTVESAVQDERGKYIAAESRADYVGVDRFVGLKARGWVAETKKPFEIGHIVVDDKGIAAGGTKVAIAFEKYETTGTRVKGAGNAYIMNYDSAWQHAGDCASVSTTDAQSCSFTPQSAGSYRAVATITDTKGRSHAAGVTFWVTGGDYVMWDNKSDTILPIVPEKTDYHVGDTARFLIKNPLPGATALITQERFGVITSHVQKLEGSTPVIEVPVTADDMPGFYLSVLVVSPRVDKPVDDQGVDLGKPTFRLGYITVPVKDKAKEMNVTVKAMADTYRPRDKVEVSLHAEPRLAQENPEPIEYAVAVLDESVFDLVSGGLSNFDPYNGFYSLAGLDLRNYTLLSRMIGRQKFEKKGANPGGDGGANLKIRDLFKFVSYWNPSLKADARGNADFTFEAPDNLTGWRVLAMAVTPSDRLGLGQGNFKVNRPTELRPVMPNQVTEGDSFRAGFSVMNRTDKPRTLKVTIAAEGDIEKAAPHEESVTLDSYKRATVYIDLKAARLPETADASGGKIHLTAKAVDAVDSDATVGDVPVNKRRSLDTAATYGTTDADKAEEHVKVPEAIYPDTGSLAVALSSSVIGGVEGAFRYMRDYTYNCWEQLLTRAVMAANYENLKAYLPDTMVWKGAADIPQSILDLAAEHQAPNGGMAYFRAADEYVDPYLSAYTAMAFNWLRADGFKPPQDVEEKLQAYLQDLLRNNVAPTFYDEGMTSTVRAVALAALAERGKAELDDVKRYAAFMPQMSLFGKTHLLMAAIKVKGGDTIARDAAQDILGSSNQTGGKFAFVEQLDDSYTRILATPGRENCVILGAFSDYAATGAAARELVGDVPFKLVRSITQSRQGRDHWQNTQENVFCMQAFAQYAKTYESVKPHMIVKASTGAGDLGTAQFESVRDPQKTLERPLTQADIGKSETVTINRAGQGRLYYAVRLRYAPRDDKAKPTNAGIELHREYSVERDGKWELLGSDAKISRGDIVRVDLYLSLPAARHFVAVSDPVPGGLEAINRELGTASQVDAAKGDFEAAGGSWFFKFSDWIGYNVSRWSFYHQEIRNDAVRFYADELPAGNYHLSYSAQAIAEGDFSVMPAIAEEMYDPDTYGKDIARKLRVEALAAP